MLNEAKVAEIIKSRYTTLNSDQQSIFERVEQYKAMYHCEMEEDESYPWDFQLTDPQIFPIIRAYLARMNPAEARISLIGKGEYREINQQLANWELNEILITQLIYKIMYSGFMAGHGYAKTGWFFKPALKIKTDNRGEVIMRSIQNRADAAFVRFNDLFIPNRNIPELSQQPYTIERVSMRYGDLLDDQEATGHWKPDWIKKIGEKKMFTHQIDYGVDLPNEDAGKEDSILRSQYVSLLCMYTADAEEFWRLEDGDNKIGNKDTDNRYWHGHSPYIDFCPFPEDDEYFSLGVPHTVADLEIALSSTLNQLLTNARKSGNAMWMVGESGKQVPDWMFTDRPNGIVRVKGNLSDYQKLKNDNHSSSELLQLRSTLQTSTERTSGISSLYASGVSSSPQVNKTATGAQIIDNNIDQNLQLLISLFGAQILKRMGEHFLELNQQYITQDQIIEVSGKGENYDYITVPANQISADFKVKASPERLLKASPAVKLASLQNTINTLEKQNNVKVNTKPMYEGLIRATPGLEDIDPTTVVIDPQKKVDEVIHAIVRGFEPPEAKWDDDHQAMLTMIQKNLIDHPEYTPEQLVVFKDYIDELNGWILAKNNFLLSIPQKAPVETINFKDLPPEGKVQMAEHAKIQLNQPEPQLNPLDPNALAKSMSAQAPMNPTRGMSMPMTKEDLGMMGT